MAEGTVEVRRTQRLYQRVMGKCRIGRSNLHSDYSMMAMDEELTSSSTSSKTKILNPLTNRYIRQTSICKKGSTWRRFMYEEGGYIAHRGVLVPINHRLLANKHYDGPGDNVGSEYFSTKPAEHNEWNKVSPSLKIVDEESQNKFNERSLVNPHDFPSVDQLLFVQKPAKLLTLPGIGPEKADCLAFRVKKWLGSSPEGVAMMTAAALSNEKTPELKKRKRNGKKRKAIFEPRPCHRLDFDTSGVMCVSLSHKSHQATSMLFEKRLVQKTYVALVDGHVESDFGTINLPIGKVWNEDKGFNEFACRVQGTKGGEDYLDESDFVEGTLRDATTEYSVSQRFTLPLQDTGRKAKYTRVILKPQTGRGHQLRLHMKGIGHCILGDTLHAPKHIAECTPRLCLHAETIQMHSNIQLHFNSSLQTCQLIAQETAPF